MRRFIFQSIGNAVALFLTFQFIPGLYMESPEPLLTWLRLEWMYTSDSWLLWLLASLIGVLILGAIYTAIDRYIKPLMQALSGNFLVWSLGLSVLVVNVITFYLFIWLTPVDWFVSSPYFLTVTFGGVILTIINLVIEAVTGINQPKVEKVDPDKAYWSRVEKLPLIRDSQLIEGVRVSQIYNKLFVFATDIAVGKGVISNIRARVYQWMYGEPHPGSGLSTPEKSRILMESLGPTWVKFGQMIASQADSLPDDWAEQLTRLQSSAEPFPSEQVVQIITAELGAPPEELYGSFEMTPLAAASTAQVHQATLKDGTVVAIKVQRPDIMAKTKADLAIIQSVARAMQSRSKTVENLDLVGMTRQFAKGVIKELDYRNEAYHTRRLADNMASVQGIHVPAVYMDLCSSRVMTQEFVVGIKLTKQAQIDAAGLDRSELASRFLSAIIKQLLVDGFFHGDPHPGNLFVNTKTGVITFLDLGLVGELNSRQRMNFLDLLFTLTRNDPLELAQVAQTLSLQTRAYDEQAYRAAMTDMYYKYWVYATGTVNFNEGMTAITDVLAQFGLRLDSGLTMAIKTMIQAGQSLYSLDPTIDMAAEAVSKAKVLLADEFTVESVVKTLESQAVRAGKQLVRNLPDLETATMSWLTQYKSGKFTLHVDTSDLTKGVDRFSQAVNRLTLGIVLVGMLIGSAQALESLRSWWDPDQSNALYPLVLVVVFGVILLASGVTAFRLSGSFREPKDPFNGS
ncbi:MAG: AarF/UbiB family protein [Caldilineaceae bacterium]